ncbi:hypothetical protein NMG60_11025919 [Bertholletia excelsa]
MDGDSTQKREKEECGLWNVFSEVDRLTSAVYFLCKLGSKANILAHEDMIKLVVRGFGTTFECRTQIVCNIHLQIHMVGHSSLIKGQRALVK